MLLIQLNSKTGYMDFEIIFTALTFFCFNQFTIRRRRYGFVENESTRIYLPRRGFAKNEIEFDQQFLLDFRDDCL
jgi:hypothetical protein